MICKYYKRIFLTKITLLFITLILVNVCFGQESSNGPQVASIRTIDDTIKREMAMFTLANPTSGTQRDSLMAALTAIRLVYCTDSVISFSKGNLYGTDFSVSIWSEKTTTSSVIKAIYLTHYKFMQKLPDSVYSGLYDPNLCIAKSGRKKPGVSNCKVFRSKDRRRIYIYMLNGKGAARYEVTWVVQDSKYYARVVNPVPESR